MSVHPMLSACVSASSVSVASLSASNSITVASLRRAAARSAGKMLSISPINTSGVRPNTRALPQPESAATMTASAGSSLAISGRGSEPPKMMTANFLFGLADAMLCSLRWNYPDQVCGSVAATTLSARCTCELPVRVSTY